MAAPRGKGVEHIVTDLGGLSIGDRQSGSGRGTPWSNPMTPKTKPAHIDDKRGKTLMRKEYQIENIIDDSNSGVSGDPISIVANYIRILSKPSWQLFQYHIGKKR